MTKGLWILVFAAVLPGCAGTLDKAISACYALDGGPAYTKAEGVEKFSCDRQNALTATVGR